MGVVAVAIGARLVAWCPSVPCGTLYRRHVTGVWPGPAFLRLAQGHTMCENTPFSGLPAVIYKRFEVGTRDTCKAWATLGLGRLVTSKLVFCCSAVKPCTAAELKAERATYDGQGSVASRRPAGAAGVGAPAAGGARGRGALELGRAEQLREPAGACGRHPLVGVGARSGAGAGAGAGCPADSGARPHDKAAGRAWLWRRLHGGGGVQLEVAYTGG